VERSHPIDAEEFYALLDGLVIDDATLQQQTQRMGGLLQLPWPPRRPRRPTPYERLRQKTQTRP
jgi:hypothetical protein